MSLRLKNTLYTLILLIVLFGVWKYRSHKAEPFSFSGDTMGTTYHISCFHNKSNLKESIDSLLMVFNQSLSTFIEDSEISRFNKSTAFTFHLPFFYDVLKRSKEIYEKSGGAFDPTVMPLVNAWGFGPAKPLDPDSAQVDSLLQFVGFDKIMFNSDSVWKNDPRVQLDFSALAKGYGTDVVSRFLSDNGIKNYFVEIGGEVRCAGKNLATGNLWSIGILDPEVSGEAKGYIATVLLQDKAMATSGNYFNYREVNGKRFSHTIDPHTGYPVQRNILSASVIAKDCMTSDGWATACMVVGYDSAVIMMSRNGLETLLVNNATGPERIFVSEGVMLQDSISTFGK